VNRLPSAWIIRIESSLQGLGKAPTPTGHYDNDLAIGMRSFQFGPMLARFCFFLSILAAANLSIEMLGWRALFKAGLRLLNRYIVFRTVCCCTSHLLCLPLLRRPALNPNHQSEKCGADPYRNQKSTPRSGLTTRLIEIHLPVLWPGRGTKVWSQLLTFVMCSRLTIQTQRLWHKIGTRWSALPVFLQVL